MPRYSFATSALQAAAPGLSKLAQALASADRSGQDAYDKEMQAQSRIGQAIARRGAHGFGMRVVYHNRSRLTADVESALNASYVDKTELLRQADHLLLVLPYSADSHHAIGAPELAVPKKIMRVAEVPVLGTGKTDYVRIQQMAELEQAA